MSDLPPGGSGGPNPPSEQHSAETAKAWELRNLLPQGPPGVPIDPGPPDEVVP